MADPLAADRLDRPFVNLRPILPPDLPTRPATHHAHAHKPPKVQHRVIPAALSADRFGPGATGDGGQALGRAHQLVPGIAAGTHDGVVAVPHAMAEEVGPQVALVLPFHPATPAGTFGKPRPDCSTGFSSGA